LRWIWIGLLGIGEVKELQVNVLNNGCASFVNSLMIARTFKEKIRMKKKTKRKKTKTKELFVL